MSNPRNTIDPSLLHVATLGRTVGLKGDMKLHIKSDFPEQFVKGAEFVSDKGQTLRIASVNLDRELVKIDGFDSPEAAKRLTNAMLFTTKEATREACGLEEGEFFWFDVVGCRVFDDDGRELGTVQEIERIGAQDYLAVRTEASLVAREMPKSFLIPYQDPFIVATDIDAKRIDVKGGLDILQAS